MEQPKILVIGSANLDLVATGGHLPQPGESARFLAANQFFGGKGANQAVAAARLGAQVTFVAMLGQDGWGDEIRQNLKKEGIHTDHLRTTNEAKTGCAFILVEDSGQNMIAVVPGANDHLQPSDLPNLAADWVLTQQEMPAETTLAALRLGPPAILNPAPPRKIDPQGYQGLRVITPNETEAEFLTGIRPEGPETWKRAADALLALGVQNVILTLGDQGCYLANQSENRHIPVPKVRAVDATAAGDAFNGALAVFLAEGQPIVRAAELAVAVGALAVTQLGAQSALPTRAQLSQFLGESL